MKFLFVASNKVEQKYFFYMQTGLFCILFSILFYSISFILFCITGGSWRLLSVPGQDTHCGCVFIGCRSKHSSLKVRSDLESVVCPSCGFWCHSAPTTSHRDTSWEHCLAYKNVHGPICTMNCYHCQVPELVKYKPWSSASSWSCFQRHHCISSFKFSFPKLLSL